MNIVITGSTRGIGLGLAKEFLNSGHNVMINGRSREKCEEIYRELHSSYPDLEVHPYACDITNHQSVIRMYEEARRYFRSVDIWINNAGMNQDQELFLDHDINNIYNVLDLNLKAVISTTQLVAREMSIHGGYIYNMEGFGSNDMMVDKMSIYGTTKRALTYFTKSVAKELRHNKVKVGLISPGMVITDLLTKSLPQDEKERTRQIKLYNILADRVEDVTRFLVKRILSNRKNGASIKWLTNRKVFLRFITAPFYKRTLIS